jgi:outer membrane protein
MKTIKYLLLTTGLLGLVAAPVLANEPGTWILRGGAGTVQPDSRNLFFELGEESITIDVDNATSMTLSGTYMFTENWAFDVLASWPFQHDIKATVEFLGPDAGLVSESMTIGKTKHLPPTFSLQYHLMPAANFQPYVGVGVNWTTFFDTKLISEMADEGIDRLKLDDSIGVAAQVGGDWSINNNWLFNLDVRWLNIESDATLIGPALDGEAKVGKVKIDPWVYSLNLGYRF